MKSTRQILKNFFHFVFYEMLLQIKVNIFVLQEQDLFSRVAFYAVQDSHGAVISTPLPETTGFHDPPVILSRNNWNL